MSAKWWRVIQAALWVSWVFAWVVATVFPERLPQDAAWALTAATMVFLLLHVDVKEM